MPSHVPRGFDRKKMEKNMEKKPPKINVMQLRSRELKLPELDMDEIHKHSHMLMSPPSQAAPRKSSGGRGNCLCSPTTHAGSFRCRHHRATGMLHRGRSVGSNLSELGSKVGSITDSLQAQ